MIFDEQADRNLVAHQPGRLCPMCEGGLLIARQCKLFCESCGYVESCEDNFVPNYSNPYEATPNSPAPVHRDS